MNMLTQVDASACQMVYSKLSVIEVPDSIPHRLMREQNWSREFADRTIEETKRFLALCSVGQRLTPSKIVDEGWHLFVLSTRFYRELCETAIGRFIDHNPGNGSIAEVTRFEQQYRSTLGLYTDTFGSPPPEDIWPTGTHTVKDGVNFGDCDCGRCGRCGDCDGDG